MKLFYLINHQDKANVLIEALNEKGWQRSFDINKCSFLLSDLDHPARWKKFDEFSNKNKPVFLYQHAARPNIYPDFPDYEQYQNITAAFASASGHVEIAKIIGIKYPIEVIGWYFCPMRKFQKKKSAKRILFAPIHPNTDGRLPAIDQSLNINTYRALIMLYEATGIDLTVRYIRDFISNGLWEVEGVKYEQGNLQHSCFDFDNYDLVVSHQTFAYKMISRGVPVVMMGEDVPPRRVPDNKKKEFHFVKSFSAYKHILKYPLDILAEIDTSALFRYAIKSDQKILEWKKNIIGDPFNPEYFIERLESYL